MTTTANDFWQLGKLPKDENGTKILLTEQSQEIDDNLNKIADIFGGKWSFFVDTMVAPACENLFLNRGFTVYQISQIVRKKLNGKILQIDVLITNENHVLAVEVKSSLSVEDVKELIEDLEQFRQFFPEYNQKQLYGAVAGMGIEEGVDKYAYRQGLFVLAQSGENVTILNDDKFQPKVW